MLVIVLLINALCCKAQSITVEMIAEQERRCPAPYLVEKIEGELSSLDTLPVKEIKRLLKRNYDFFSKNKDSVIQIFQQEALQVDTLFRSKIKQYTEEEESIQENTNIYKELINDNHLKYRDTLQAGLFFEQTFQNNKSSIEMIGRNRGAMVYKFATEETIQPFYFLNHDSECEMTVTNIYYHDTKEPNVPIKEEYWSFPLNTIAIPQMKHVDSIDIHFEVTYLTRIDTVRFYKDEVGATKKNIMLKEMYDNFVTYTTPYDYYPYHKGTLLEKAFYNEKGDLLSTEYGLSNSPTESALQRYKERLKFLKELYDLSKTQQTREDLYRVLKYVQLKRTNRYLRSKTLNRQVVEGNVASMKLYLENQRDTLSFSARFRNIKAPSGMYVHRLEGQTAFIDKNGKLITQLPHKINFLYDLMSNRYSQYYFFTEDPSATYYFLDRENKKYIKLPYKRLAFICPSLIGAQQDDGTVVLLSTDTYKQLDVGRIESYQILPASKMIMIRGYDEIRYLYDQEGRRIKSTTTTPITAVTIAP